MTISQWVPDEFDSEGEIAAAHGETVLDCVLVARPTVDEMAGTAVVVTSRGSAP